MMYSRQSQLQAKEMGGLNEVRLLKILRTKLPRTMSLSTHSADGPREKSPYVRIGSSTNYAILWEDFGRMQSPEVF
jgi:hypothetical protein